MICLKHLNGRNNLRKKFLRFRASKLTKFAEFIFAIRSFPEKLRVIFLRFFCFRKILWNSFLRLFEKLHKIFSIDVFLSIFTIWQKGIFSEFLFAIGSYQTKFAGFNFPTLGQNCKNKCRENIFRKNFSPEGIVLFFS